MQSFAPKQTSEGFHVQLCMTRAHVIGLSRGAAELAPTQVHEWSDHVLCPFRAALWCAATFASLLLQHIGVQRCSQALVFQNRIYDAAQHVYACEPFESKIQYNG